MKNLATINRAFCRQSCLVPFAIVLGTVCFCEFFVYRIVIWQCSWPGDHDPSDRDMDHGPGLSHSETVHALILSDTHLLGPRLGHWFDKLRREWQMRQSFRTAVAKFQPEAVFVLGDLFDEGKWSQSRGIDRFTKRFRDIFNLPQGVELYATVGNHDIGFHETVNLGAFREFQENFGLGSVRLVILKGIPFVLVNSMAMDTDNCNLCSQATRELNAINRSLSCALDPAAAEAKFDFSCLPRPLEDYAKPILMQHFPLYRKWEDNCSAEFSDSAPPAERGINFRPFISCLSPEATDNLLSKLNPRVVFTGHTHFWCVTEHESSILEYNLASFNWRNLNSPSFLLARFSREGYEVKKCYLPKESTVIAIYCVVGLFLLLWILLCCFRRARAANMAYYKVS